MCPSLGWGVRDRASYRRGMVPQGKQERGLESMAGRQNPQLLQFSGDIRGEFKDLEFVSQVQDGNGNLGIVWNR